MPVEVAIVDHTGLPVYLEISEKAIRRSLKAQVAPELWPRGRPNPRKPRD
jgi:hypothetical protein